MVAKGIQGSIWLASLIPWALTRVIRCCVSRNFQNPWWIVYTPGTSTSSQDLSITRVTWCLFLIKFFCGEAEYTLAEFGHMRQHLAANLDLYIKKSHEKAVDCRDLVDKEVIASLWIPCLPSWHGHKYHVLLENLLFPSFFKLMEASRQTTSLWGGL